MTLSLSPQQSANHSAKLRARRGDESPSALPSDGRPSAPVECSHLDPGRSARRSGENAARRSRTGGPLFTKVPELPPIGSVHERTSPWRQQSCIRT